MPQCLGRAGVEQRACTEHAFTCKLAAIRLPTVHNSVKKETERYDVLGLVKAHDTSNLPH